MAFFITVKMSLELLFHLPFILLIAVLIHILCHQLRNNRIASVWYFPLLFLFSTVVCATGIYYSWGLSFLKLS